MAYCSELVKSIASVIAVLILILTTGLANAQVVPPTLLQRVEPEYSPDLKTYLIDPARVEMAIDTKGDVAALSSDTSLPDNVVQALRKWRFSPGTNNGKRDFFAMVVSVPLTRSIDRYLNHTISPYAPNQHHLPSRSQVAGILTPEKALNLEQKLKDNPESVDQRTELLMYAATQHDKEMEGMRARLISWLVRNKPQASVLGTPSALIFPDSSTSGPESSAYRSVKDLWLDQAAANPANPVIVYHATYFLGFSDPEKAEQILLPSTSTIGGSAAWLGKIYALAALGIDRVDVEHGGPRSDQPRSDSKEVEHARSMLAHSSDERVLLSALSTVSSYGPAMPQSGNPDAGYRPLCQDLITRVKMFYPDAPQSCDAPHNSLSPFGKTPGVTIQAAHLQKSEKPEYPPDARSARIQGVVRFSALIARDGTIKDLELLDGPLIFYNASRAAVLKWVYSPTTLNGKPVEVSTQIDVNFALN